MKHKVLVLILTTFAFLNASEMRLRRRRSHDEIRSHQQAISERKLHSEAIVACGAVAALSTIGYCLGVDPQLAVQDDVTTCLGRVVCMSGASTVSLAIIYDNIWRD